MDDADLRPLLTRWLRGAHLIALDVAAAVVVVAVYVRFTGLEPSGGYPVFDGPLWVGWLVAGAVGLPIAVRRRWPLAVVGVVLVASIVANLLDMTREPYTATALALYTVALAEPGRRSVPALLVCLLGASTGVLLGEGVITPSQPWTEALALVALVWLIMGAAWTVGRAVRERRASAARSAEQLAQQAVTQERLRIARELHDIVAHSMSLIAVKAGIANHVAEARPQEARDALRIIQATSRGALTDMRRLLGVLRPDGHAPANLAPTPGLAGLPELADRAGLAGVQVQLEVRGTVALPDDVGLAVYRIVQEALTNVAKHAAPARCRVTVQTDEREARIEVTNDGPGGRALPARPEHAPGHGLIGMRERVMIYGGAFAAESRPQGGFRVAACLPYQPATRTGRELL
jgi:signal transduction histidine kinase